MTKHTESFNKVNPDYVPEPSVKKEYIERTALIHKMEGMQKYQADYEDAIELVALEPMAEVVPIRYGKLTFASVHEGKMFYKCSECWHAFPWKTMNYCPNCGTKFNQEEDNNGSMD